jgi:hypothetical protein
MQFEGLSPSFHRVEIEDILKVIQPLTAGRGHQYIFHESMHKSITKLIFTV